MECQTWPNPIFNGMHNITHIDNMPYDTDGTADGAVRLLRPASSNDFPPRPLLVRSAYEFDYTSFFR